MSESFPPIPPLPAVAANELPANHQPLLSVASSEVVPPSPPPLPEAEVDRPQPSRPAGRPRRRGPMGIAMIGHLIAPVVGLAIGWFLLHYIQREPLDADVLSSSVIGDASRLAEPPQLALQRRSPERRDDAADLAANTSAEPALSESIDSRPTIAPAKVAAPVSPAEQLESLKSIRERALANHDLLAALTATPQIAALDGQDPVDIKLDVLETFRDSSESIHAARLLAEQALVVLDQAIDAERSELAEKIAVMALVAARRVDSPELIRRATRGVLKTRKSAVQTVPSTP